MRKAKTFFLITLLFVLCATGVFAQTESPWWYFLERGKYNFRSGEYGRALMSFEDARRYRRATYEQMEQDLITVLSLYEVRQLGDSLEWVERYLQEHYYPGASAALNELYYRLPKESLDNSAAAALAALGRLKDYPEAEYWIGEVYRVEGELNLALGQFQKALVRRDLFENQEFDTDLQYKIASIRRTRQEYNEMENILLSLVTSRDTLWSNAVDADMSRLEDQPLPYAQASASFASRAMTRTLENEGIGRFLTLYRYNNMQTEEAHRQLGFYYAVTGRSPAQEHLMFAFLIQNSIIIEELIRRQYDYAFTSLAVLMEDTRRVPLLASFIEDVEYYKTAYYLAASLFRSGKPAVAREIWVFLASQARAGEWQNRALAQLRRPHLEPIVEMP